MTESFFFPATHSGKGAFLPDSVRRTHVYVPGKTGHGKSNFMFWMALQDIARVAGICVIDPKPHTRFSPNLVHLLLDHIPESRKDDVIWLDLASPVPIDFLHYE